MCGIFGYIGPQNPKALCLHGLRQLEYRGYDSAGFAGISEGHLASCKEVGKLDVLEKTLSSYHHAFSLGIAHTRWATHGEPSLDNAHPHLDETGSVAVVHNGIIENHTTLRKELEKNGVTFTSDTDSEVIAQLVAYYYKGDLKQAAQKAFSRLKGSWGIALIHKDHPHHIITSAKESPLVIALSSDRTEVFISSDVNALCSSELDVVFLENEEIALVSPQKLEIITSHFKPIEKALQRLQLSSTVISKNGYPHFMLKEIFEQPDTIMGTIHNKYSTESNTIAMERALSQEEIDKIDQIIILACGTSYHAGMISAELFEETLNIPSRAEVASEFRYRKCAFSKNTLFIAISQSGETLDTLCAVREAKRRDAKVIGICNTKNSSLTREAHYTYFLEAGKEVSVCSTKAFTNQVALLTLIALSFAKSPCREILHALSELPRKIQHVLNLHPLIHRLAKKYSHCKQMFFLGRQYMYTTCLEAALKLKEISYIHAQAYPAGEMKHGPIALVDDELPVVFFCGHSITQDKTLSNLSEIKARKAPTIVFAPDTLTHLEQIATDALFLPTTHDALAPILYAVASQLFAYYIALERGTDIDQPRNLAKSVTVE